MKKSFICLSVAAAIASTGQLQAAEKIELSGKPIKLEQQNSSSQMKTSVRLAQKLGLNNDYSFVEKSNVKDIAGNTHTRFQQTYKGIPVWAQQVVSHSKKGTSESKISGQALAKLEADLGSQVTAKISKSKVIDQVKAILPAKFGKIASYTRENAELYIYQEERFNKAILAYHVELLGMRDNGEPVRQMFLIDANNGRMLKNWNALMHIDATGPGGNEKTGRYEYGTDYPAMDATDDGLGTCMLENTNVRAVDLGNVFDNSSNTPYAFTCPENTYQEINGAYSPINDAFFFGNLTFDMYSEWYDTAPLPFQLSMKVHFGSGYENAFWDGQAMTFGDGASTFYPLVDVNVSVHEVSHGFTDFNSDLIYSSESGGMNEAFSDIAGEAGEYYWRGEVDWFIGGDIMKNGDGLRYFEDPTLDGRSIGHYDDYVEGMDVHYSSGIFNRAYYLLSNKEGWNPRKAFDIFVLANQVYWMPDSTFEEGACGVLSAAFDLEYEWFDVYDAFQTVGVSCSGNGIDEDMDGMSDITELVIGFDPTDPSDAAQDFDGDGISNLVEINSGFDPKDRDTDDDGLTDGDEYTLHGTMIANADTDDDGMSDGWEIANGFNPLNEADAALDADEDGYSNLREYRDGTDPNDATSYKIGAINKQSVFTFEDEMTLTGAIQYPGSNGNFVVTDSDAFNSGFSIGSEDIADNQWVALSWDIVAEDGVLNFDVKTSTEAGWDYFVVFVDFTAVYVDSGENDWQNVSIPLSAGPRNIIFYYEKDSSVSVGDDMAWVDNVTYTGLSFDADGDGMVDAWEEAYGLDMNDPADAALDADEDGLTNLEEYNLDTDPTVVDTDGDTISDFDEVDGGVTNPLSADTDGDMIPDNVEIALELDPADAADGLLDLDNDGFNNSTEAKYGTSLDDATSSPDALEFLSHNFEDALSANWNTWYAETWAIESDGNGNNVLRSEPISNNKDARIDFVDVFEAGTLTFNATVNSEENNDSLLVMVDGELFATLTGSVSQPVAIDLEKGEHTISLIYRKNGVLSSKVDRVEVSSWQFVAPDIDSDGDGLTNAEEMTLGTKPMVADSDGDGLMDGDEARIGTDPLVADSDGDGFADGIDLFPLDATRWLQGGGGPAPYLVILLAGLLMLNRRKN